MDVAYANTQAMPEVEVVIFPATKSPKELRKKKGKLRVAAYCRVSTDDEEQLTSYENQIEHYTEEIQRNPEWKLVDIFADEGISGVNAKKREEFKRMIDMCHEHKIDRIITKSITRFARNVLDSIRYVRELKSIGVSIFFEKENIDTGEMTSEMMIALYSVFAQAESESISNNVKMGKRFGYKLGKVPMMYENILGYRKGEDGQAKIIPEEAEIIITIFTKFLEGYSYRGISKYLMEKGYQTKRGNREWSISSVQRILRNEKYKGDVLVQKTYIVDLFEKKAAKNTGELPMYLIKNHHTPIIEPTVFDMVQVEMARRNSLKAMSDKCPTFKSKFSSKYALTGLVICGDCGGKYRRTTWSKKGKKKVVWRCISRLDYGTKYCSESVTIEEERLHSAIMEAINSLLDNAEKIKALMRGSISEILSGTNTMMQIHGLESSIKVKNSEIVEIIKQGVNNREDRSVIEEKCKNKHKEVSELQTRLNIAKAKGQIEEAGSGQLRAIYDTIDRIPGKFTDYDEEIVRSMVTRVKILSKDQAEVTLFGTVTLKVSL
jgi:site-specific DNA recombinase